MDQIMRQEYYGDYSDMNLLFGDASTRLALKFNSCNSLDCELSICQNPTRVPLGPDRPIMKKRNLQVI